MKDTLDSNIASLKSLLKTSQSLSELITKMSSAADADASVIDSLNNTKVGINKAIDDLITNTDELFNAYEKMIDAL